MSGLVLFLLNAVFSAVNIGLYAAWGKPFSLGFGVLCGLIALAIAMHQAAR
jgi:hypothetical protein